jgi:hypothetical protein
MPSIGAAVVLAHQGGWDEILLVAGPVVVIIGVLAVVKRRVDRAASADDGGPLDVGPDGP